MFDKLYYITQGERPEDQLQDLREALEAGCKLIQLRMKTGTDEEILPIARQAKTLCVFHEAKLIINDRVDVARAVDADGVHLGLTDMTVPEARQLLGATKIIGGTANTLSDVLQRINERCDYVGLGPLRFTSTKEKLSPVLGFEGYKSILSEVNGKGFSVPVYAIGGITPTDIDDLKQCGVFGIAVSGIISKSDRKAQLVREIEQKLK